MGALKKEEMKYTYEDYCKLPDDGTRWELIDGELFAMAAPSIRHQRVSRRLSRKFFDFFPEGNKCEVFVAPLDVRLNFAKGDDTAIQPDLLVVCDSSKIEEGSLIGAPDLAIEIWSPNNTHRQRMKKFASYRNALVRELWFVDPETDVIDSYKLNEETGKYEAAFYTADNTIPIRIFPNLTIEGKEIFDRQYEEEER
ncbi:MAG: Uma2 family endonuclease [Defluviitaleaceae bacterium]|nr:Uma2 family endonuclease [Defluviitaleaceae bacterium]